MRVPVILLLMLIGTVVSAQPHRNHALYCKAGASYSGYVGFMFGADVIYKERFVVQITGTAQYRKTADYPDDFESGIFGWGWEESFEEVTAVEFLAGYALNLNQEKNIRLLVLAGGAPTTIKTPCNWERHNYFLGPNYDYDILERKLFSYVFRSDLEFPLSSYVGFTFGVYCMSNYHKSMVGINTAIIVGLLRNKN